MQNIDLVTIFAIDSQTASGSNWELPRDQKAADLNLINESLLMSSFELHVGPFGLDIALAQDDDCLSGKM